MSAITWVQGMARTGRGKERTPAELALLDEVREASQDLREHEADQVAKRKRRNRAIVKASKKFPATEIAQAADIKQSYVSRIVRSRGKPESGSTLDQQRDKEPANA